MMPELSEELRQALDETQARGPIMLVDPVTSQKYVLLREDIYDRFRAIFGSEGFDIADTYAAQDAVAETAWDHPGDAAYDDYDAHRRT
jgi:hypothetical protein